MPTMYEIFYGFKEFLPLITSGGAVVSAVGLLPRIGPGRAAWIARLLTFNKLQRPTPDKVFRKVERDGIAVLVPASNAIGIVLHHGLSKKLSLNELEELIKK